VNDLIIAALEESRINRAEGLVTFGREAGREGDRMLFRDPHVESALWEDLLENIEARAARHSCSYRNNLVVPPRFRDQGIAKTAYRKAHSP